MKASLPARLLARLRRRREFDVLCQAYALDLPYAAHRDSAGVLREVFVERRYADGFPFGQSAVVVDVGAHRGYFALFAARHTAPGARIVAVEPHPETVAVLRDTLARNGAAHVAVEHAALTEKGGTARLHLSKSWSHSVVGQGEGIDVPALTLTALLDAHGLERVDFLKLDCEGAEYEVLFSAPDATLARIDTVSVEFHDRGDARYTGRTLARHLAACGFEIVHYRHAPTTRDLNYGHLLALRRW